MVVHIVLALGLLLSSQEANGKHEELTEREEAALRKTIQQSDPVLYTKADAMGFPRQYVDIPEQFLQLYKQKPMATVSVLLDVVKNEATEHAHMAYLLAVVRDGETEGWQGLAYRNHREIDIPDQRGETTRSRWTKNIERLQLKLERKNSPDCTKAR